MSIRDLYRLIYYVILLVNLPEISIQSKLAASGNEATLITQNIDQNVDPCDNFYKFACGNFIKTNEMPDFKSYISRMDAVVKKVKSDTVLMLEEETKEEEPEIFESIKNYFKACMDTVTIEKLGTKPMLDVIQKLGGWPIVEGDNWKEENFSLLDMMIKLRNLGFQHKYLVNIYVFNNYYNTSHYQLYIDKAEQYLTEDDLSEDIEQDPTLQAYHQWMVDVAVEFGANRTTAINESLKVIEFEQLLAQLPYLDSKAKYEINRVVDLENNIPWFPWLSYLNRISDPFIKFDRKSKVYTDEPYYFELLVEYLKDLDKRTLANYLIWRAVTDSVPHLSKNIRDTKDYYYEEEPKPERLDQCLEWLNSDEIGLPIGVSALYIRKYFSEETRREVKEIVHAIANEFQHRLQNLTWLDDHTKERARRKSEYMKRIVGHPDEMLNDEILNNYVQSLKLNPKDHFSNILNVRKFQFDNSLSQYNEHGNYMWSVFSGVTGTNAFYYKTSNSFVILAGILRRPLFHPEWPSYAKYGSIGFIIGHEMMHAYDWDNFKFDETGSFRHWYSNESAAEYRKRLDCFEEQYAQFRDERVERYVDGKLTLDENIADNVGLKVAYDAFENQRKNNAANLRLPGFKYTPEQLFWIYSVNFLCSRDLADWRIQALKDHHAPDDFRALGEMSNSKHFAEAFNCPEGSPMNPVKKCKLV